MSTELDSNEIIKINMETAMEWMSKLNFPIRNVSVFDFGISLMAHEHRIEFLNNILEIAKEKGVDIKVSRRDNGFTYYTCEEIRLEIFFTN